MVLFSVRPNTATLFCRQQDRTFLSIFRNTYIIITSCAFEIKRALQCAVPFRSFFFTFIFVLTAPYILTAHFKKRVTYTETPVSGTRISSYVVAIKSIKYANANNK